MPHRSKTPLSDHFAQKSAPVHVPTFMAKPAPVRLPMPALTRLIMLAVTFVLATIRVNAFPVMAASPGDWSALSGSFAQADGSQYNSGKLQLLPLDSGCVLFELAVMKGSEAEAWTDDFLMSGTFVIGEDGSGTWEDETESGAVSLRFTLAGQTVTVTQKGRLPLPVDGAYTWLEPNLEVTADMAGELVEGLPTAATSLNANNGAYRLEFSDIGVDGWFYELKAVFGDNGAMLGEFLIAKDLSAVYRIDTEEPLLLYGSANAMMAAMIDVYPEEGEMPATVASADAALPEEDTDDEATPYAVAVVDAVPSSPQVKVGETAQVVPVVPGHIPATFVCTSDKPDVAAVDAAGTITGVAPGTAVLSGTLSVDGAEKPFRFEVDVWAPAIQPLQILAAVPVGGSAVMQAKVVGLDMPLQWRVSDNSLAEIDAATGVLKGKKDGKVQLVAQAGDLKREWTVAIGNAGAAAPSDMSGAASSPASSESAANSPEVGPADGPVDSSGPAILATAGVFALVLAGVLWIVLARRRKLRSPT